ncbi:MAG: hypothetical protein HDT47_07210 [Ruminococcaceae bacterium]|nr:hypothetical protein [Oscillospiraceae bacterium]
MKKLSITLLLCVSMLMPLTGCNAEADTAIRKADDLFDSALEFTGLPVFENNNLVSSLNNKECCYQPFCYDSERIYFTNAKDGQYLYSYDGESLECLVEMPVHSLNYHDNCIFFLSDKELKNFYNGASAEGYLYRYDLSENKAEKLSDFIIRELHVNDKGIFYIDADENNKFTAYQFDESTGKGTPKYHSLSVHDLNGYHICFKPGEEKLEFYLTNNEETYKLPVKDIPRYDCIVNGKYYYRPQFEHSLIAVDLAEGKSEEIPIPNDMYMDDYTVFDGTVYMILDSTLFKLCGGELKKLEYIDDKLSFSVLNNFAYISHIFSGSNAMYTLVEFSDESDENVYDFAEIILNDDGETYYIKSIT